MPFARPWLPLAAAAALTLAATGCRSADPAEDLVLIPRTAEQEPGLPLRYVLLARSEVVGARDGGAVELWLPLPSSDEFQTVHSLAVEVGPPGRYALEEAAGDRVLHVAGPSPTPVSVRALIERARVEAAALPRALREVPAGLEPTAWAEAAAARGVPARVAHGLELRSDGQTVSRRWPEVLVDGAWSPVDPSTSSVDLPPGRVRLASAAPRATVDGHPAELRTSYALEERR